MAFRRHKERQYDSPMAGFVLLHSPLVGPSTWRWVAEELRTLGNDVNIPVISHSTASQGWEGVVSEVLTQLPVAMVWSSWPTAELGHCCPRSWTGPMPERQHWSSSTPASPQRP